MTRRRGCRESAVCLRAERRRTGRRTRIRSPRWAIWGLLLMEQARRRGCSVAARCGPGGGKYESGDPEWQGKRRGGADVPPRALAGKEEALDEPAHPSTLGL